jgi:hypothetical protein
MKSDDRKGAIAAYKERKTVAGVYAVRCMATGQFWIGRALDLSAIQNRLWFTLRQGAYPHRSLQEAWKAHGADAFIFAELERLEEEELAYVRDRTLKERLDYWRAELNASAI